MRLYFATDVHASTKCWRKFLGAAKHYEADVIVMGGDITGKVIVPLVRDGKGRLRASFLGLERKLRNERDVERLRTQIDDTGYYSVEIDAAQHAELEQDPDAVAALFRKLVVERVEEWVELAEQRLSDSGVRVIVNAGNDDFFEIDEVLERSPLIERPEGRVIELSGGVELLGVGYANQTPWDCPRDLPEPELATRIRAAASDLRDPSRAIFDIHVPPAGTALDRAPKLDEQMRVVASATGEPQMVHVGSTAVRDAILEYQPLLGLHGHIHESQSVDSLGRSQIVNPGSEYGEGVLRGAVLDIDRGEVTRIDLVTG